MNKTSEASIGQKVAEVRTLKGISQAELRRRTSINIWRIEQDRFTPNIATLKRIAEALEVPVSQLIE